MNGKVNPPGILRHFIILAMNHLDRQRVPQAPSCGRGASLNLGQLYYRTGREREAEPLWKRALEVNPNYAEAYSHLAVYYYNLKDFPQAAYYLDEFQKRRGRVDPALVRALQPYMNAK